MTMIPHFEDLFDLREGSADMTVGAGPTRISRVTTLEQWRTKADALRALYHWTLGRRPDGYDQPLDMMIDDEQPCDGYTKRTVSYNVGPDERIIAYVLIPENPKPKHPAVLTLHPTNETGREQTIGNVDTPDDLDRAYGLHLVRRGYVTFSYDMDSTHDRLYPKPGVAFDNTAFYDKCPEWSGRGKDLYDLSRAIDVLEQMPKVDAKRIGSIGHSQGGGLTTDGMAADERIVAGVNNCGDWPFAASKNPFNRCRTDWWIGNPQLRPFALAGKPMPIDLHEKLALAAPRPQMLILSLVDFGYVEDENWLTKPVCDNLTDAVRRVYDLHGISDGFELVTHNLGHSFLAEQREIAYAFLDKHLKAQ
jgi:dienelactone hydrolase